MIKKLFLTLSLVCFTGIAQAEDLNVYLGAGSIHPGSDLDLNSNHKLVGIEYKSIFAGYFENSFHEDSFALGYRAKFQIAKNWEFGLMVGASYGYRNCTQGFKGKVHEPDRPYLDENGNEIGTIIGKTREGGYQDYLDNPETFERADRRICPGVVPMLTYTKYSIQPTLMIVADAVALSARAQF